MTGKLSTTIKFLRQRKKLSQENLARQAGLKLSNLAKLESGYNTNPTLETLRALAKVLTKGSIDRLLKKSKNK